MNSRNPATRILTLLMLMLGLAAPLAAQYAGHYSGTYTSIYGEAGVWSGTVDASGNLTGRTIDGLFGIVDVATGSVNATGGLTMVAGTTGYATFYGQISGSGSVSGTWYNSYLEIDGTFTGAQLPATVVQYAGSYSGSFSGAYAGTWTSDIDAAGNWTGSAFLSDGTSGGVNGIVDSTGNVTLYIEGGGMIMGEIDAAGHLNANWATEGYIGPFSGDRLTSLAVITVEQPAGIALTNGGTKNFGTIGLNSSNQLTFTVRNDSADYTTLDISVDGTHSAEFQVGTLGMSGGLFPGEEATFTVTFGPRQLGSRSATLHLTDSSGDTNLFDLNLAGLGEASGQYDYQGFDGAVTITSCADATGALVIPSMLAGMPVTGIDDWAFSSWDQLTSVHIPARVSYISSMAFNYCVGLTTFTVAAGNTSFSALNGVLFDFGRTKLIRYPAGKTGTYTIPSTVISIGDSAFDESFYLSSVSIPVSVTSIGTEAFAGCVGLTSINLPNNVASIGNEAFTACTGLTSVTIPANVYQIGSGPFVGCSALTSITVASGNADYYSIEGVLFNTVPALVQYPAGKPGPYTIPNTVTTIGTDSFIGCTELTSVTIPASVKNIESYAFYGCTGLTSVTIPASVTNIGYKAFDHCTGLVSAYFIGNSPIHDAAFMFKYNAPPALTVYYQSGNTGFSTSSWPSQTVAAMSPSQEITVVNPADTALVDNGTGFGFGSVEPNLKLQKTFTILNVGMQNLTGLAITKNGTNTAEFEVGTLGTNTLAAGASTTFTVAFAPSAIGNHTAAIHIASNDSDETQFDIALTGTGSAATVSLLAAVDQSGLALTVGGNVPWLGQSTSTHDAIDAAQSGAINDLQESCMQTTLTGPGTLTYWWQVSSELGFDFLEFYLDGVLQPGRISGSVSWQQKSYHITAGTHIAKWRYKKDESVIDLMDAAWVDQVSFIPNSPVVTTGAASAIASTSATLSGSVNPNSAITTAQFEYGLTTAYGNIANVTLSPNNGSTAQATSANITSLQAGSTYHYRLTATNSGGTSLGSDMTFTTLAETPAVTWLNSKGLPANSNLLSDPNGDGVNLLIAYALNLEPKQNLSGSMPQPTVSGNLMSLSYYAGNPDVTYIVETSTDLKIWNTNGVTSVQEANQFRKATVAITPGTPRFMRIRVLR